VQDAWVAFATAADPSTAALAWPPYDPARRATAALGAVREIRDAPFDLEREAWTAHASATTQPSREEP
jgi:carboxylesterase type B